MTLDHVCKSWNSLANIWFPHKFSRYFSFVNRFRLGFIVLDFRTSSEPLVKVLKIRTRFLHDENRFETFQTVSTSYNWNSRMHFLLISTCRHHQQTHWSMVPFSLFLRRWLMVLWRNEERERRDMTWKHATTGRRWVSKYAGFMFMLIIAPSRCRRFEKCERKTIDEIENPSMFKSLTHNRSTEWRFIHLWLDDLENENWLFFARERQDEKITKFWLKPFSSYQRWNLWKFPPECGRRNYSTSQLLLFLSRDNLNMCVLNLHSNDREEKICSHSFSCVSHDQILHGNSMDMLILVKLTIKKIQIKQQSKWEQRAYFFNDLGPTASCSNFVFYNKIIDHFKSWFKMSQINSKLSSWKVNVCMKFSH